MTTTKKKSGLQEKIAAYAARLELNAVPPAQAYAEAEQTYRPRKARSAAVLVPRTEKPPGRSRVKNKSTAADRDPGANHPRATADVVDAEVLALGVVSRLDPYAITEAALHLVEAAWCLSQAEKPDEQADKVLGSAALDLLTHKRRRSADGAKGSVLIAFNWLRGEYQRFSDGSISAAELRSRIEGVLALLGVERDAAALDRFVPDPEELRLAGAGQLAAKAVSAALGMGKEGRNIYNWRKKHMPVGRVPVAYGRYPAAADVAYFFLFELADSVSAADDPELRTLLKSALVDLRQLQLRRAVK